jgi:DNA polymerase III subunit gamma/tau
MERYKNLAITLRPQQFKGFLYNEHIVTILKNIVGSGRIPAGILLSGTRGVGKTTLARLFARAINCGSRKKGAEPCNKCQSCVMAYEGNHPDIIEVSGSTNGNIDDIRAIIDQAMLTPMAGQYKVFIIDEAHGLGRSMSSWDALLKVLEEPPPHIVWIFCTTQKHKLPDTIKSRLVTLDLKIVPTDILTKYLTNLLKESKGTVAAPIIARAARNSVRDALTLTEKVAMYCTAPNVGFTESNVLTALGAFDETKVGSILGYIQNHDSQGLWMCLDSLVESGIDIDVVFNEGIISSIANLMGVALGATVDRAEIYQPAFQALTVPRIVYMSDVVAKRSSQFYESTNKKFMLQLIALELCA